MREADIAITVIWVFLLMYSLAGSVDFGAGFWAMVFERRGLTRASLLANRFLSPAWKVTNVFLVLLVVALVGFFPHAAYVLGTVLLLPGGLLLFLLTVRSSFMVYSYSVEHFGKILAVLSGVTGLLVPGLLVSVLPISLGGFVTMEAGYPQLQFGRLLLSVTEYAHLAFGIGSELFLSSLFLADYAHEAGDATAYRRYRRAALVLGPLTLAAAILVMATFAPEARWILPNLRRVAPWFGLSVAAFVFGYAALFLRSKRGREGMPGRPRVAVVMVAIQYTLAVFAYGAAHRPYIVYPFLTIDESLTNTHMFWSLFVSYIVSTLILIPVFVWFWKLFFRDKTYLQKE